MLLGFEDAFMEIQSGYITLCLDLAGNVDEVNVFIYQDDVSCTFNAFFVKDGKIKTPDESAAESIVDKFYELGVEDIEIVSDITEQELWQKEFFRVYLGNELKALYAYDASKNNYKVYKML